MLKFDSSNVECSVFTYKEGVLSVIAHDLKLKVSNFEIMTQLRNHGHDLSQWALSVKATFDATSLKTVCAMKDGKERSGVLNPRDCKDIEKNIVETVLKSRQFPKIRFSSVDISGDFDNLQMKGKLTLCAVTRTITFPVVRQGDNYVAEVVLNQTDFGIKPFSALLGAMKVKPELRIRVRVSLPPGRGE